MGIVEEASGDALYEQEEGEVEFAKKRSGKTLQVATSGGELKKREKTPKGRRRELIREGRGEPGKKKYVRSPSGDFSGKDDRQGKVWGKVLICWLTEVCRIHKSGTGGGKGGRGI